LISLGSTAVGWIIPAILLTFIYCAVILSLDRTFTWRSVFHLRKSLFGVAARFLGGASVLALLMLIFDRDHVLDLPLGNPELWTWIMVCYPIFSAGPQEVVYRVFFFHRYRSLLENRPGLAIGLNGTLFGLAHLVFFHWQAPVISFLGGLLFAGSWRRHRSLPAVALEHALWGDFIISIGLHRYFMGGSVV
ncbi:MAG: CPBP family intramembrane glutamic endopeptidase, partial [Verrucomicrobiota bacterium]